MSKTFVVASVPNCPIIVWDAGEGDYPEFDLALVRATGSAVVVTCVPWSEGPVQVTLGDDGDVDPGEEPVSRRAARHATPRRLVRVVTVELEVLAEHAVAATTTRVRVWANDPVLPDRIVIGLA